MAHNINYNEKTGKYSFYSVQQKPWHELGHIADSYETSAAVLENAGLNFTVEKRANVHRLPSGKEVESATSFFTFRTDNEEILGTNVGAEYTIVQNADAFAFFDAIAGKDGVFYETAGALGKGEKIFITAKLPGYIKVGNDDLIEKYLFLTTCHDGKGSIIAAFTPIRIVCNNTLNAALGNCTNVVKIRHTDGVHDRLKEAHKVMGMVNTVVPILEQAFNHFATVKITDEEVKKLIYHAMAPSKEVLENVKLEKFDQLSTAFKNTCEDAFAYAMISDTQAMDSTKGTLFGAYNAITGYYQNVRKYKDNDEKIKNILYGGTAQAKGQTAFDLCQSFAQHGNSIFN
jgi:phage/plasmid-like protein (TIGR03299 family)